MKKIFGVLVLIAGILIIALLNFENVRETFELNSEVVVDTKEFNKDNKYIKADIKIPVLTISNKKLQNSLNEKFNSEIMEFYSKSLKEAEEFSDDFPEYNVKFVVSSEFEVKKNSNRILSIIIKYYEYSGGAHGMYSYNPYNIDLASGEILSLEDIFKPGSSYQDVINSEIDKQIIALNLENNLPKGSEQIYNFSGIGEKQKFYLTDENIVIFFELYEIAPYAAGMPEFSIEKEVLEDIIKEEYRDRIFSTQQKDRH